MNSGVEEAINGEYEQLHKKVHSTYRQFKYTAYHFMDDKYKSVYLECSKVSKIYNSTVAVIDFFYYLLLTRFPEFKKELIKNKEFLEIMTDYDLPLMHERLWK